MLRKLRRDELVSERAALEGMLASLPKGASLTARSLRARVEKLDVELKGLEATPDTTGNAAVVFGGRLVQGSRAIDAEFAARSLKAFQDLVSKKAIEKLRGQLGQRGPLPERSIARLNVTGTIHGSFGFLLEEDGSDQPTLFPSAVKDALASVSDTIAAFASDDEALFVRAVEEVDSRFFVSLREFFKSLHDAEGTVKIIEGEREQSLGRVAVERAFDRAELTSIEDVEETVCGRLIGVLPVSRTFEFTREDTGITLKGRVGPQVGDDFLQRIERETMQLGKRWRAKLAFRTVARPRASPKKHVTLVDLEEADAMNRSAAKV